MRRAWSIAGLLAVLGACAGPLEEPAPVTIEAEPVMDAPAADAAPDEARRRIDVETCKDGGLGGTGCPVE